MIHPGNEIYMGAHYMAVLLDLVTHLKTGRENVQSMAVFRKLRRLCFTVVNLLGSGVVVIPAAVLTVVGT